MRPTSRLLRAVLAALLLPIALAAAPRQQTGQKFLPEGQFVWHEIKSPDPVASAKFYTSVFDWKLVRAPVAGPEEKPYVMLSQDGQLFAGVAADEGLPRWTSWVQVVDADLTGDQALKNGGLVVRPPAEHLIGRVIEVAGPGQARLTLVQLHIRQPYVCLPPIRRHFAQTRGAEGIRTFYQDMTGWTLEADQDNAQHYEVVAAGHSIASLDILPADDEQTNGGWLPCIEVRDLRRSIARAVAAGGKQLLPPEKRAGLGQSARLADPQGAEFWLVQP